MVQQSIYQRCFLTSPSLHAALSPLRPRSPLALSPHSQPEGLESQFLRARLLLPRHLHHPSGFSSFPLFYVATRFPSIEFDGETLPCGRFALALPQRTSFALRRTSIERLRSSKRILRSPNRQFPVSSGFPRFHDLTARRSEAGRGKNRGNGSKKSVYSTRFAVQSGSFRIRFGFASVRPANRIEAHRIRFPPHRLRGFDSNSIGFRGYRGESAGIGGATGQSAARTIEFDRFAACGMRGVRRKNRRTHRTPRLAAPRTGAHGIGAHRGSFALRIGEIVGFLAGRSVPTRDRRATKRSPRRSSFFSLTCRPLRSARGVSSPAGRFWRRWTRRRRAQRRSSRRQRSKRRRRRRRRRRASIDVESGCTACCSTSRARRRAFRSCNRG